ncbi:MAG: ATP-binding protein [Candidatus Omnitrophota bacterium]|nr:ATP-binding protein [Candidatus Omnitrophota bacterium]
MNPLAWSGMLIAVTCFGLAGFIFLRAPRVIVNKVMVAFNVFVGFWGLGTWLAGLAGSPQAGIWAWRLAHVGGFPLGMALYHLASLLYGTSRGGWKIWAAYGFAVLSIALCVVGPAMSGVQQLFEGLYYYRANTLYTLILLTWSAIVILGHRKLFLAYRRAQGLERKRLKFIFFAMAIGFIGGTSVLLPAFSIPLYPYGNFSIPIYAAVVTYAIVKHHLMDINVVIRRGLQVSLLGGLLVAGYFGLIYAAERLFKMGLLQHHVLALSLTAMTTLGLGLLVFLAEPKKRLNQIFGLYSLAIAWWAFSAAFMVGASDESIAKLWSYLNWPLVFFIAPTFIHTVFLLADQRDRWANIILKAGYGIGFLCLVLHLFFRAISVSVRPVAYVHFYSDLSTLGLVAPITFVVLVNIALWKLYRSYRASAGQRRTQLKYLFWGSLIGYLGGSPSWLFCFGFHIPVISPFGVYGVPLYSIATTYAVLHHRLFDFNLVARKSLIYSILVTLLTVGYFGLIYVVERLFQTTFGYQSTWLSLAAFALMALTFQPLKIGIQRLVDWLLFRAPHEELVKRMERLEQEVRQADKLKAISTLAAGMAHEIKNPLTAIKTFTEFLPEKYNDPSFREKFTRIVGQEVGKIDQLVHHLLDFAKPAPPHLQPIHLSDLLDETLDLLSNDCLQRRVHVERTYSPNGSAIQADPQQFRQVFLNLFLNSLEAMDGQGGTLTVSTTPQDGHLTVTIADTGPGIPKEHLPHLGEPFFTTKPSGTGLGLSIVQSIIQEHGGRIMFKNRPTGGACCTLLFPLASHG